MPYKDKQKQAEYQKEWFLKHPNYLINRRKDPKFMEVCKIREIKKNLKKYNINIDKYNILLKEQEFKCAICNTHQDDFKRRLSVDHNHKTGKIRGLLCNECNLALGNFKDSTEILDRVKVYLLKFI